MNTSEHPLAQRRQMLRDLPGHLRGSHLGIDHAIDRLMEAVRPWYLLAGAQTRPRVVGLWGMTGTGKSSLVRALVTYLKMEDRTFWLDAGELRRNDRLDDALDRVREHHQGLPFILVVDEFQHARTMKRGVEQEEPVELRRLWELMDSGRAVVRSGYRHGLSALLDLEDQVRSMLELGVGVEAGKVTRGKEAYRRIMRPPGPGKRPTVDWALPESAWDLVRDHFPQPMSLLAFRRRLEVLDGPGVLALLRELVGGCIAPKPVDGTKALILVLGNLDELYTTGQEPLPEVDPEVLLSRHRALGTTSIHHYLMGMFRVEQVARMGTDHIVFPPMGRLAVEATVSREADALAMRLSEQGGLQLRIGKALKEHIQRSSTIAVLGARPIVAAVHRVLPDLYAQVLERPEALAQDRCELDVKDGRVVAVVKSGRHTAVLSLTWPLHGRTGPENHPADLRQCAVHEAGHVICGVHLAGRKALQVCARTSSERVGGFVIWAHPARNTMTRAQVVPQLATLLGGWAAELLMLGTEGVSSGCSDDLEKASRLALALVKEHGFGADRFFRSEHASSPSSGFRTLLAQAEEQAQAWLKEAEELALRTLEAERGTLLVLTDALVEAGSLGPSEIEALLTGIPHLVRANHH